MYCGCPCHNTPNSECEQCCDGGARIGGRLAVLLHRIDVWESLDEEDLRALCRASDELLLDIKQCLESILE